ncbi:hypothetical protein Tco_0132145 [Tanacetum coccineum]
MAYLTFANSHNMVAYFEKSEANADFAEIVNFLNASSIRYALTVSPTIYVSYIEQFWSTAKIKTVNNETQICAKVDGKTIVITESSVRRDLHFDDGDVVFNDEYDTPSHTKKVFANMRRQGKDFSRIVTPLFATMLIQPQADVGEGSGQPIDSQHPSITASPSIVVPIHVLSSSQPQKTQKHRKTKRKSTKISQSSGPTTLVADETVNEERGDIVERAATTATSLDVEQGSGSINRTQSAAIPNDPFPQGTGSGGSPRCQEAIGDTIAQTRSERVSTPSYDSPLLGVNTPESDEERIKLKELMDTLVLEEEPIELVKDKGSAKKVVSAAKNKDSTAETVTTASVNPDDVTLVETLMAIRSSASRQQKLKGVIFKKPSEPTTITTSRPQLQILAKDKGKGIMLEREREEEASNAALIEEWDSIEAIIDADRKLVELLQAQEREELTVEEQSKLLAKFIETRRKYFEAKRAEENINKPPIKTQQRKVVESSGKKDESSRKKAESSGKEAVSKKRAGEKLKEESVKRQKVEDDAEKAELKLCLEIALNDDKAINIEPLATKSSIVDWETQILGEELFYYQIMRVDGSSKVYKVLYAMLNDFDRQDLIDLHRLVKERFKTTQPKGYDRLLWGDLMIIFEPGEQDELWRNQQHYSLISYKLFDSCGVHSLLMDTVSIHMLVERIYPLTQLTLERMLNTRLQVDHECEMAYELIKFIKSQYKK